MRSLVAVADHGAITEAAEVLCISQPALSRRIKQLEEGLGIELFERSQRGVVLTDMGRLVVAEGRAIIDRFDRMQDSVHAHQRLDTGVVRIGGGATAVAFLMPEAIARFTADYPGVVFRLKEAGSREIERDVIDERLELGVVTLPVYSSGLQAAMLRDDRIVLVASRAHPLARAGEIDRTELSGHDLVGFEAGSAIRLMIDTALRDAGVEMNVTMELRSISGILQMVRTTRRLAFVSELGLEASGPEIERLAVRDLSIVRQLAIITKRGRPLSLAAERFVDVLLEGSRQSAGRGAEG